MKLKFIIKGLDCANCASELERKIQKIEGIKMASISFMSERMIIECEENEKNKIIEEIKSIIRKEEPDVILEEK